MNDERRNENEFYQYMFVQMQVMNYELDFDDNHIYFLEEKKKKSQCQMYR